MACRQKVKPFMTGSCAAGVLILITFMVLSVCGEHIKTVETDPTLPEPVKFYHYSYPDIYVELCHDGTDSHLEYAKLNKDRPTFVIIDGFLSSLKTNMTQFVKNAVLEKWSHSNVIVVDWSVLSGHNDLDVTEDTPYGDILIVYNTAKMHVDLVGRKLAKLLNGLVRADKADFSKMHLIGYSLGAHIAGVAGQTIFKKYHERITRITGLDPAGPGFPLRQRDKRLDDSDAEFVDIYYTSRYTAGDTDTRIGHADIYINGGKEQPGCESVGLFNSTLCNHGFAYKLWNHCMVTKCLACRCTSVECKDDFRKCSAKAKDKEIVGMNISLDLSGDFYLKTGSFTS